MIAATHPKLCMTLVRFVATKGRGVHILKPGSKRRRKDAEIRDQYEYE